MQYPAPDGTILQSSNFLSNKLAELKAVYTDLEFKNEAVLEVGKDIILSCVQQRKFDLVVSKTSDCEILFYRVIDGSFNNIILDSDCDIEFMHIPSVRSNSYNEYFTFAIGYDVDSLVQKL